MELWRALEPLTPEMLGERGQLLAEERTPYRVDIAKAEALRTLGEPTAAAEVMERWVELGGWTARFGLHRSCHAHRESDSPHGAL